jgi:hypothetical protein
MREVRRSVEVSATDKGIDDDAVGVYRCRRKMNLACVHLSAAPRSLAHSHMMLERCGLDMAGPLGRAGSSRQLPGSARETKQVKPRASWEQMCGTIFTSRSLLYFTFFFYSISFTSLVVHRESRSLLLKYILFFL